MSVEAIKQFYNNDQQVKNVLSKYNINQLSKSSKYDVQKRFELVSKLVSSKTSILEIGTGYGFFLKMMKSNGYNIEGVEISDIRRDYAKKISKCKIHDINFEHGEITPIGPYDVVLMFQVLEHVTNPIQFLKNISTVISKKGKIIIEIPNTSDIQLNHNTEYRKWFWQVAHVNYFSPKTIKNVLKHSGFLNLKIIGLQRYGIENMFHWKILKKSQLKNPSKEIESKWGWLENFYKNELEEKFISDTLICIGTKK